MTLTNKQLIMLLYNYAIKHGVNDFQITEDNESIQMLLPTCGFRLCNKTLAEIAKQQNVQKQMEIRNAGVEYEV